MSGTLERLTLTLNPGESDEREYDVSMLQSVDVSSTKEAFSIAPPGLKASENILLGISGKQADITVRWNIHDDGTDKANGKHSSTVVTITEQTTYLEKTMQQPDFGAGWTLDHATGAAFNDDEVFLETVDVTPIDIEGPRWTPATLRFRRGSSVG